LRICCSHYLQQIFFCSRTSLAWFCFLASIAPTAAYSLSLHDALPIWRCRPPDCRSEHPPIVPFESLLADVLPAHREVPGVVHAVIGGKCCQARLAVLGLASPANAVCPVGGAPCAP